MSTFDSVPRSDVDARPRLFRDPAAHFVPQNAPDCPVLSVGAGLCGSGTDVGAKLVFALGPVAREGEDKLRPYTASHDRRDGTNPIEANENVRGCSVLFGNRREGSVAGAGAADETKPTRRVIRVARRGRRYGKFRDFMRISRAHCWNWGRTSDRNPARANFARGFSIPPAGGRIRTSRGLRFADGRIRTAMVVGR